MKDLGSKLEAIIVKHKEIEKNLSTREGLDTNSLIRLNKEYADLNPLLLAKQGFHTKKTKSFEE